MIRRLGLLRLITAFALASALIGCATSKNPADPFEPYNRVMFDVNDRIDQVVLKPAATVYKKALPSFAQTAVYNFFGNLADVWTAANNFAQGKPQDGANDVARVLINSTFGLAGLIDIGSNAGLVKHKQDFGATLGTWGINSGPYVVLPLLGSSTLRDTVALPVDWFGDLWLHFTLARDRYIGLALRIVDQRAALLDASTLVEEAALDRYEFIRDAYLQRRASKIGRGKKSSYQLEDEDELDGEESSNDKERSKGKP